MAPRKVRTSELKDYKKCKFKWYLRWRRGLKPRKGSATALQFGTWIHWALEQWRINQPSKLGEWFSLAIADSRAKGEVNTALSAELSEYRDMGLAMLTEYERVYGNEYMEVIGTEVALSVPLLPYNNELHMKLDLVYADRQGLVWIRDYKTTKAWSLDHLGMDDQTSAYLVYAERALKAANYLGKNDRVHGMQYDFLRKGTPDERPRNALGQALNIDGTVSKRQGSPMLQRVPIVRTRASLCLAEVRLKLELEALYESARDVKSVIVHAISKNPGFMCANTCEFFQVCKAHEEGIDVTEMIHSGFKRSNPYDY